MSEPEYPVVSLRGGRDEREFLAIYSPSRGNGPREEGFDNGGRWLVGIHVTFGGVQKTMWSGSSSVFHAKLYETYLPALIAICEGHLKIAQKEYPDARIVRLKRVTEFVVQEEKADVLS